MPEFNGVHHINLSVTDLEQSTSWYTQVLGLTKGWEMPDQQGRGQKVVLLHPDSPLRLVLSHHQSNDGATFSEFRTGLDHLALAVADKDALEEWRARFEELGVQQSPIAEGATGWLITFRDPDNMQWEMYTQSK